MELTLDTHLQLLEWVPKRAQGLQGTLSELRAVRGLLPHSKILKIALHWEGRCSQHGLQTCDSQTGLPAPSNSAFALAGCWHPPLPLFTQEGELQGAESLCSLLQPGLLARPWAGRSNDTVPPMDCMDSQFPGLTSFLQALPKICMFLCAG